MKKEYYKPTTEDKFEIPKRMLTKEEADVIKNNPLTEEEKKEILCSSKV